MNKNYKCEMTAEQSEKLTLLTKTVMELMYGKPISELHDPKGKLFEVWQNRLQKIPASICAANHKLADRAAMKPNPFSNITYDAESKSMFDSAVIQRDELKDIVPFAISWKNDYEAKYPPKEYKKA